MAKWKKRIKKALKTAGKIAAIGGAGYLGAKAFGGKKRKAANLASSYANVRDRHVPYDSRAIAEGIKSAEHDSDPGTYEPKKWYQKLKIFKKGGRVTGIAKRGFGRALMKGKK